MQEERAGVRCSMDAEDNLDHMERAAEFTGSIGVLEYWVLFSLLHYSITPLLPLFRRDHEALNVSLRCL
jgi:hypothetical protein